MKTAQVVMLLLSAGFAAHADFSFTMTQKSGPGNGQVVKHAVKGQKTMQDRGRAATIVDFDAQTVTTLDRDAKTYKVARFADLESSAPLDDLQAEVRNTGERKSVNGFNATQVLVTVQVDMPPQAQAQQPGAKVQMEIELWLSRDVPGSQELLAFYRKNAAHWPAVAVGGSPSMQKAMAKLQQQFRELDGVPVMEVIRMKPGGGGQQTQKMNQAREQLEALAHGGGPGAEGAQQALARMDAMTNGSGSLFDITMEAGNFSAAPIPDSAFAVPAGYQKLDK